MGAQLAMRVGRSVPSWMLLIGMVTLLAADLWYAYLAADDAYNVGHPVDALWWTSYVAIAALVVHERVGELSRARIDPSGHASDVDCGSPCSPRPRWRRR